MDQDKYDYLMGVMNQYYKMTPGATAYLRRLFDAKVSLDQFTDTCVALSTYFDRTAPARIKSFPQLKRRQCTREDGSVYFVYTKFALAKEFENISIPNPDLTSTDGLETMIVVDTSILLEEAHYFKTACNADAIFYDHQRKAYIAAAMLYGRGPASILTPWSKYKNDVV